jgi:hypothetical protein
MAGARGMADEAGVMRAVLQLLALRGWPAWRTNAGAVRDASGRPVRMLPAGFPDVLAIVPRGPLGGHAAFFECKRPGGKPTAAQATFLANVTDAGAIGMLVDDVGELARILDMIEKGDWECEPS